jgi:hypothetical protein
MNPDIFLPLRLILVLMISLTVATGLTVNPGSVLLLLVGGFGCFATGFGVAPKP